MKSCAPEGTGNERGAMLVELLLVLPMLFIMTLFVIEYVSVLEQKQLLTALNREASTMAFRDCSQLRDYHNRFYCLERVRAYMQDLGNTMFGRRPELILSLYGRYDEGVTTWREVVSPESGVTESLNESRFVENDPKFGSEPYAETMGTAGRAFIGEAFLQYRPRLLTNIPLLGNLSFTIFYDIEMFTTRRDE